MKTVDEIKEALRNGMPPTEAIDKLTVILGADKNNEEAYIERGMLYWGANKRALAINDYHSAIALNPNSTAKLALQSANEILDFYNKDLYNP